MEKILEIKHLSKSFGSNVVLRDIDFTVSKGDVWESTTQYRIEIAER